MLARDFKHRRTEFDPSQANVRRVKRQIAARANRDFQHIADGVPTHPFTAVFE